MSPKSNIASLRVLENCGFVPAGSRSEFVESLGETLEEVLLELRQGRDAAAPGHAAGAPASAPASEKNRSSMIVAGKG